MANYTYSHSLDYRSTWHSGSSGGAATDFTTAFLTGSAYGEAGYSMDPNAVYLEYGNSLFDITHRFVGEVMWEVPWMKSQHGLAGHFLGGWTTNAIISLQGGFPFTVGAQSDFNGTGIRSQRPNTPSFGSSKSFTSSDFEAGSAGASNGGLSVMQLIGPGNPNATCATVATSGCLEHSPNRRREPMAISAAIPSADPGLPTPTSRYSRTFRSGRMSTATSSSERRASTSSTGSTCIHPTPTCRIRTNLGFHLPLRTRGSSNSV